MLDSWGGLSMGRGCWFWGLRLHLVTTLHSLPVAFAVTRPGADERQVLLAELDDPALAPPGRAGHRIRQRHVQGPARPRTTRWPHSRRRHRPRPAAHPRPHRRRHWHNDHTGQPIRRSLLAYDHWPTLESLIQTGSA